MNDWQVVIGFAAFIVAWSGLGFVVVSKLLSGHRDHFDARIETVKVSVKAQVETVNASIKTMDKRLDEGSAKFSSMEKGFLEHQLEIERQLKLHVLKDDCLRSTSYMDGKTDEIVRAINKLTLGLEKHKAKGKKT